MKDSPRIRILVADDHPVTREGLALILDNQADMTVVAQAANGREAIEQFARAQPDVALIDLQMPELGGVEAIEAILRATPQARLLVLTTYDGDEDIFRAMRAGAKAYLLKDSPREEILRAIRRVRSGQKFVSPEVGAKLAERLGSETLTEREVEVLALLSKGLSNKEIAATLEVTEGTIKSHVNNLMAKMNVASRTEAALVAGQRGLLRH